MYNVAEKYAIYFQWKGYMDTYLGVWIYNYYADGKVNNCKQYPDLHIYVLQLLPESESVHGSVVSDCFQPH